MLGQIQQILAKPDYLAINPTIVIHIVQVLFSASAPYPQITAVTFYQLRLQRFQGVLAIGVTSVDLCGRIRHRHITDQKLLTLLHLFVMYLQALPQKLRPIPRKIVRTLDAVD